MVFQDFLNASIPSYQNRNSSNRQRIAEMFTPATFLAGSTLANEGEMLESVFLI